YDACGPERTGYEFLVLGEGDWPSLMGIFSVTGGRIFYAAGLILAALTLLLLAFSVVSKRVWQRKSLLRFFLILSGTLSLFFIADLLALFLWFWGEVISGGMKLDGDPFHLAAATLPLLLLLLVWLRKPLYWRRKELMARLMIIAGGTSLVLLAGELMERFSSFRIWGREPAFLYLPLLLYLAAPLLLWFYYGLSRREERHAEWPRIRSKLLFFYVPAVLSGGWMVVFATSGGLWGLPVFVVGLHLITVGYLRLASVKTSEE
ncbi:MAG: hypothetical protein O6850_05630, partial [Acidobacteria bacterium]|nr:hypothetical protein [Acidobacteriota bacterium]